MHDPRYEEPLTDAALDRAIEQALDVEPTPAFVARVRHRVSSERPLRGRRGWLFTGLAACATPVVLVLVYLALPGRSAGPPEAPTPSERAVRAPVRATGDPAIESGLVTPPPPDALQADVPRARGSRRPTPEVTSGTDQPEVTAIRHTIAVPEIVISQAEVNAVFGLLEMRVFEREQDSVETAGRTGDARERGSTELDVAALAIPPLVIEPLQLTARLQGEGE